MMVTSINDAPLDEAEYDIITGFLDSGLTVEWESPNVPTQNNPTT